MTNRASIHGDVFAVFGRDDDGIVIAGQPGSGKRSNTHSVPRAAAFLTWLRLPWRAALGPHRQSRDRRGVHR